MKPLGGSQKHTSGFGISHICDHVMDGVKQSYNIVQDMNLQALIDYPFKEHTNHPIYIVYIVSKNSA
jgi:hypothetical protein